jgi:hypothetical protein
VDALNKKLEDFYKLESTERDSKQFMSVFKCLCLSFFVERSQEGEIERQMLVQMLAKLQILIESDLANRHHCSLMKPDALDILIELLRNENTFQIKELTTIVLQTLLIVSESEYVCQTGAEDTEYRDLVRPLSRAVTTPESSKI